MVGGDRVLEKMGGRKHSVLNWVVRENVAENVTLKPSPKGDERANHAEVCEGEVISDTRVYVHAPFYFWFKSNFPRSRIKLQWKRLIPTICHVRLNGKCLKVINSQRQKQKRKWSRWETEATLWNHLEEHSWVSREERWCPTWPQKGCRWQAWPRTSTTSGIISLPSLLWVLATRRLPSSFSASSTLAKLLSLLRLNQRRSTRCRHREQSCGHSEGSRGWDELRE